MSKTIFQKIIDKEIPSEIVYEDELVIAIKDVNPVAPVHLLIIPKKCIPTLNDLTKEDTTVFNCNDDGGQTVYHIHLHLIGGRKMNWPPG